jgi:predicted secreted protein
MSVAYTNVRACVWRAKVLGCLFFKKHEHEASVEKFFHFTQYSKIQLIQTHGAKLSIIPDYEILLYFLILIGRQTGM